MENTTVAIAVTGIAFFLTVIWGDPFIRLLKHWGILKVVRVKDLPKTHASKMNMATMGGFMFLLPVTLLTIILNAVTLFGSKVFGMSILVPLASMWGFAVIGAVDDWEGVRGPRRGLGMSSKVKLILQIGVALVIAFLLHQVLLVPEIIWPFTGTVMTIGWPYIIIATFIIVAMANAMNFTDGMDGLAGLISLTAFGVYGIVAMNQGQVYLARFCFCLVGALAGFLWFNASPANLFMGDTGSQALGASLAVVALMTGQWIWLPLIAIIPTAELLSVIIQVLYFKATKGKRVFKKTPIHHHFEEIQWPENKVVMRFWLIELMGALIGLSMTFIG